MVPQARSVIGMRCPRAMVLDSEALDVCSEDPLASME